MPIPEELRRLYLQGQGSLSAFPPQAYRKDHNDARQLHAHVNPGVIPGVIEPRASPERGPGSHVHHAYRSAQKVASAAAGKAPLAWWDDPIALGALLILVPPIGLAAVWSSRRYSSDARWALTVMTALTMCLTSAVVIAALTMR